MKNLLSIFVLCCAIITSNHAQKTSETNFTTRMNNHITRYLSDDANIAKAKALYGHTCDKNHIVTEEEIKANAAEAEKHVFIRANMVEYMKLYFPQTSNRSVLTDTFICDNGGFENNFLYYRGYSSTFTNGSNTCVPYLGSTPSVFVPATLPTTREFEIVTTGTDGITGLSKVKFGSKSLKLNDPYSHVDGLCEGDYGVNKLVKRFKVTEENRDFTVWYALALENPSNHSNSQPFFSIKCDLAPLSNLCFDADILDCDSTYNQPPDCGNELMDVLDWTCHRVKIPQSEIGEIATLEIVMGDCGQGGHNGYAFIDGICEECTGSSLGSITLSDQSLEGNEIGIDYVSCYADIATICGSYTDPYVCGKWYLDSISVPGFTITNYKIDTINKLFCFEFNIDNFDTENIEEIFVTGFFKRYGGGSLPAVFSNTISIDRRLYVQDYYLNYTVSECYDNDTPDFISDDYYFIDVNISGAGISEAWTLTKQLTDPYPNESGFQTLASGSGNYSNTFGPLLIQDGSWELTLTIGDCTYQYLIEPPGYCICEELEDLKISNIQCMEGTPNDTWEFDIFIPGSGTYILNGSGVAGSGIKNFNTTNTIAVGTISNSCVNISITGPICEIIFTICPPKPCDEECLFEANIIKRTCDLNGDYTVKLDINNTGSNTVCYTTNLAAGTPSAVPGTGVFGPYNSDVEITIHLCSAGCTNCSRDCYKVIKVYKPDCASGDFEPEIGRISSSESNISRNQKLVVQPNPNSGNELRIISSEMDTYINIYDISGNKIDAINFTGREHNVNITNLPSGTYIIKYHFGNKINSVIKFIKL